jgi:hypothetical protein
MLLTEPRRHLIWFVYEVFDVDLSKVKEVFIDATYNTSRMAMHLYAIITEELGYGIPIGYILVEVHHREDTKSNKHARESLECNRDFFKAARDLGVKL